MKIEYKACFLGMIAGLTCGLIFLPGCSSYRRHQDSPLKPSLYSLPVQNAQKIGSARYPILPGEYTGSQFEVYYQGLGLRKVANGYPVWSLRIQVSCVNHTDHGLTFCLPNTHVIDNRGDTIQLSMAKKDGKRSTAMADVDAHAHAQFDLFFDLPHRFPVEKIESFNVYWRYRVKEKEFARNTLFVRQRLDNVRYADASGRYKPYDYFIAIQDSTAPQ